MADTTNAIAFTEEQDAFREVVARFLATRAPAADVRALVEAGRPYDADVWQALAQELGVTGLHLPEACGGGGFGPVELGIVLEEMGRQLYTGPYFTSSIMAGCALHSADADAQAALFPTLADGSSIAALALDSLSDPARLGLSITASADGAHLDGTAPIVPGGLEADVLLVLVAADYGLGLFRVSAADVEISPLQSLDPARPVASIRFANSPAERIGTLSPQSVQRLWDTLSILLAHELVGAAEALLYGTVEYMEQRMQFGRPIASFQALKHRCADLLMEVELAKALAREGARVLASDASPTEIAHMAKSMASDAAMSAARAGIQLRGGIGFTWENDTHFYFKRIKSAEVLFGTPQQHREWLMTHLEATAHAH